MKIIEVADKYVIYAENGEYYICQREIFREKYKQVV